MEEVWKDIKDYKGIYQVSNLGRIKRLPHRVKNRFGTCCRKEHYIGYKGTNGYMIGDASGKEGQFSDSDKKCAENAGYDYMDVNDFIKALL